MQPLVRLPAVLLLALVGISCLHAQVQSLTIIRRVNASVGIVMVDQALMRTTNNGKAWIDITPRHSASEAVAATYFLDEHTGWSVLSASSKSGEFRSVRIVSTGSSGGFRDGRSFSVPVSAQFLGFWAGAAYLTFSDPAHGWLELQRMSSSNFKAGIILRTQDGGRSWTELPVPPTVDNISFLSSDIGWIAGGPGGFNLYRTANGGESWADARVPPPTAAVGTQAFYSVPQRDASGRVFLAVTFVKSTEIADSATLAIYTSHDEGATWELYSVHSDIPTSSQIPTDLAGTSLISVYKGAKSNAYGDVGDKPVIRIRAPVLGGVLGANFADSSHGWLVVQTGTCKNTVSCESLTQLLTTSDGGESTQDITPKSRSRPRAVR